MSCSPFLCGCQVYLVLRLLETWLSMLTARLFKIKLVWILFTESKIKMKHQRNKNTVKLKIKFQLKVQ